MLQTEYLKTDSWGDVEGALAVVGNMGTASDTFPPPTSNSCEADAVAAASNSWAAVSSLDSATKASSKLVACSSES